ncbi:hypothetical protein [Pantoea anthophila]|uniref:hypothetical protein n=1 Tax=Pantoea anthophila TaxID=470931 RepID=UPI0027D94F7D|nr:hypothetical protein [uncultured Pantoea sp.]
MAALLRAQLRQSAWASKWLPRCLRMSADTADIIDPALRGLGSIWREGFRYAKAGVMLGDFYPSGMTQFDLFSEQQPRANADALMAALESINRSGKDKVWFAGQ